MKVRAFLEIPSITKMTSAIIIEATITRMELLVSLGQLGQVTLCTSSL